MNLSKTQFSTALTIWSSLKHTEISPWDKWLLERWFRIDVKNASHTLEALGYEEKAKKLRKSYGIDLFQLRYEIFEIATKGSLG